MNEPLVVIVRGLIAFFTLLIFTRVLGKQQLSQLTYFDYILGITIGSIAATMTTDLTIRAWPHFVGLLTWTAAVLGMKLISLKWRYASKYLDGEPSVVIMNGQIMEEALRKMKHRVSDLMEELRNKGVFDLTEVEFAVLETNGQLSVLKKSQYQPVTPDDLKLPTKYKGLSSELIYDGVVVEQNLNQANLDLAWLDSQLKRQGIKDPAEVFLATLDTTGDLYVDTYKDRVKKSVDIRDYH